MTTAVVIGGGVVGTSVAFRLARAGVDVTLVEADHLAAGTSGASFAWTNANKKTPEEYFHLNVFGMAEHRRLQQELGEAPWLHEQGNLTWAESDAGWEKLHDGIQRLRGWGYAAELVTRAEVAALEPELALPEGVEQAVHYPTEGHVDVPMLVGRLANEAVRSGATIRTNTRVEEIVSSGGKVAGVRVAGGERIDADVVVSCAGRWTDEVLRLAGLDCPLAPSVGLTAVSTPTPITLRGMVHTPVLSLKSDGAGRMMMRGVKWDGTVDATTPTDPVPPACQEILAEAVRMLPGMKGASVETARIGVRPCPADKKPLVGSVPSVDGLYLACMHSGVSMGPFIGRLLATEITTGTPDERLAKFRPERLVTAA